PLALSGGRSDAAALMKVAAPTTETLTALGILGDLGAVRLLVDKLGDNTLGAAAATALQLITGAELREEVFVPQPVEEDEMFDDEQQVYEETGETPRRVDNRPFGVNVERASQNPDHWREWLQAHRSQFDPALRYRLGKPFSLATLVDTLVSL